MRCETIRVFCAEKWHDLILHCSGTTGSNSWVAQMVKQTVKNLPEMQETWVPSVGWEDPLVKGMAVHSSILAWRITWTEEPGGLQSIGSQTVRHNWISNTHTQDLPEIHCWEKIIAGGEQWEGWGIMEFQISIGASLWWYIVQMYQSWNFQHD